MRGLPFAVLTGLFLVAQPAPLEAVRQAESAFARLAESAGIQPAFATWLLPDANVFLPRMTTARAHYGAGTAHPGLLRWEPEAMGLAASGELAWSTGPWTFAPKAGAPVVARGHFVSVWRQVPGQGWRVVADIGVPHGDPGPLPPFTALAPVKQEGGAGSGLGDLQAQEAELARAWRSQGGAALLPRLGPGAWVFRPGRLPLRNRAAWEPVLTGEGNGSPWVPSRVELAASGDLGWACGEAPAEGAKAGFSFLRVWAREGGVWRVLADVRLPHPPIQP